MLNRRHLIATAASLAATAAHARPKKAVRPKVSPAESAKPAAGGDDEDAQAAPGSDPTQGSPADTPLGPVSTSARWAVMIDFTTGATLLSKDADTEMPPSSMTKLMTAYIVYSKLKAGTLRLDQTLPVSEHAWRTQGSKMFVELGAEIKVEDLIRGMIIQSGNDACIVLAEGIAGSEEQFVDLMNAEAAKLGLTHSVFRNCTGWPDPAHHMSVRDIAMLAKHLIKDFPEYYHFDAEKEFTWHGIVQYNRNPLVQHGKGDGLKTGHTDAGGFGVVGSAEQNGRRIITVLNGMPSKKAREEEIFRFMSWGFANFENVTMFAANDAIEHAPVYLGTLPTVKLVTGQDITLTLPRAWRQHARIAVTYDSPIPAPITVGDKLGVLSITGQGVPQMTVPLLAADDVPRLSLPGRAVAAVTHFLTGV